MKQLHRTLLNWRTHILAILVITALLFILCECDDIIKFITVKAAGFLLVLIVYRLARYWDSKGKINELMELINEEDY